MAVAAMLLSWFDDVVSRREDGAAEHVRRHARTVFQCLGAYIVLTSILTWIRFMSIFSASDKIWCRRRLHHRPHFDAADIQVGAAVWVEID
jgi:hypothetical protein